jgi:hypothetical protein
VCISYRLFPLRAFTVSINDAEYIPKIYHNLDVRVKYRQCNAAALRRWLRILGVLWQIVGKSFLIESVKSKLLTCRDGSEAALDSFQTIKDWSGRGYRSISWRCIISPLSGIFISSTRTHVLMRHLLETSFVAACPSYLWESHKTPPE